MNLFFLIAEPGGTGGRFLEDVTPLVPEDKLEVLSGVSALAERLRKPRDPYFAVLVLGPSHEDLKTLASLRDHLKEAKILLVLHDQGQETVALAHLVKPTYITDLDNGTSGGASVLKRLFRDVGAGEGRT